MTDPAQLVQAYLNGELSDAALKQFEERLAQDPTLLREWAGACFLDHELSKHYKRQAKPKEEPAPAMSLAELAKLEEAADAELVHLIDLKGPRISWRHPAVWVPSAAAACALAALIGLLVIQGLLGTTPTQPTLTLDPLNLPAESAQPITQDHPGTTPVATITATHNARWNLKPGESLRPGDALASGQRLTLTQGFAEITTARGAVAILEAPATVEFTDSDNALRLHTGKLVGICETVSSKGFVVRTPHMQVTDLGTRFGVDASQAEVTAVHVFDGEVTVARPGQTNKPLTLTARQAAVAKTGEAAIARIAMDHAPFARLLPAQPAGTGVGLAVGDADPNWRITAIDGKTLDQPIAPTVADPAEFKTTARPGLRFLANDPARSQWVSPMPTQRVMRSVTYQTTFDAAGFDPQTLALQLRLIADNRIASITLNGRSIAAPDNGGGPDFTAFTPIQITDGFAPGMNTLTITTERYEPGTRRPTTYWTGLRAELELSGQRQSAGADN